MSITYKMSDLAREELYFYYLTKNNKKNRVVKHFDMFDKVIIAHTKKMKYKHLSRINNYLGQSFTIDLDNVFIDEKTDTLYTFFVTSVKSLKYDLKENSVVSSTLNQTNYIHNNGVNYSQLIAVAIMKDSSFYRSGSNPVIQEHIVTPVDHTRTKHILYSKLHPTTLPAECTELQFYKYGSTKVKVACELCIFGKSCDYNNRINTHKYKINRNNISTQNIMNIAKTL